MAEQCDEIFCEEIEIFEESKERKIDHDAKEKVSSPLFYILLLAKPNPAVIVDAS